jgi:signal peptidase I
MRDLTRALVWLFVLIGIVIGVARATAIRWWRLPEDDPYLEASVAPTLRGGDLLVLWRLTKPEVGDLVLCPEPAAPSDDGEVTSSGRIVIGRIVAEGGDNVHVKAGRIHVNGRPLPTDSTCEQSTFSVHDPETQHQLIQRCSLEKIGVRVHQIGGAGPETQLPLDKSAVEVNAGQVWLASDNRMLPFDSRDYGALDLDDCKETVIFRLVSARGFFDVESRLTLIR